LLLLLKWEGRAPQQLPEGGCNSFEPTIFIHVRGIWAGFQIKKVQFSMKEFHHEPSKRLLARFGIERRQDSLIRHVVQYMETATGVPIVVIIKA